MENNISRRLDWNRGSLVCVGIDLSTSCSAQKVVQFCWPKTIEKEVADGPTTDGTEVRWLSVSVTSKKCQMSIKVTQNDFTSKIKDFDNFSWMLKERKKSIE